MLFNIDEKQLMLELKNKDERALKICMNKYYRYVCLNHKVIFDYLFKSSYMPV